MEKTRKITFISLTLLLLAIGLVGCGKIPAVNSNQNVNQNTNVSAGEVDTSDWKTYQNEEYGFEFKYPGDWVLDRLKNGVSIKYSKTWEFGMKEGFAPFSVEITRDNLQDFIKFYEGDFLNDVPLTRIISQEKYVVDNKFGTKLIGNNAAGINSYYIFIVYNQQNYLISFNENEAVQRIILSTFHFLK